MTGPHATNGGGGPQITVLWITAGLGCDGESVALTAATQPSVEDIVMGGLPGIPKIHFLNPFYSYENADEYMAYLDQAASGTLGEFILVVEGSIPDETNKSEGYWATLGTDGESGEPILTVDWIDRIVPHAWAVMAVGTCATYGGIHAMEGNPTGAMGLPDHLGWNWRSRGDIPTVCVPGCPTQPDNLTEVLLYLLYQWAGRSPMIDLDEQLRPRWLFSQTLHEGCDRGGYYEQGQFADAYGSRECIVKLGCWGPVVQCNVGKRGWINGMGGCANVGGICIGCTMPGFPDKFMPFMNQPPGSLLSSQAVMTYGKAIHALRRYTQASLNKEPAWRQKERSKTGKGTRRKKRV
ncbi:MAG: hydrogenase expression protein HypE [Acidobacteriota bacterium]